MQEKYRGISEKEMSKVRNWLANGTYAFLEAGILFLITALLDLVNPAFESFTPQPVISLSSLTGLVFVVGIVILSLAIFKTHQVISFILHPESIKEISGYGSKLGVFTRNISSIGIILPFSIINIIFFIAFFMPTINGTLLVSQNYLAGVTLGILFGLGSIVSIPLMIKSMRRNLSKKDAISPLLTFLPYILLFLITVKIL